MRRGLAAFGKGFAGLASPHFRPAPVNVALAPVNVALARALQLRHRAVWRLRRGVLVHATHVP